MTGYYNVTSTQAEWMSAKTVPSSWMIQQELDSERWVLAADLNTSLQWSHYTGTISTVIMDYVLIN